MKNNSLYAISDNLANVIESGIVFDEQTGEIYFDESDLEQLEIDTAQKAEAVIMYAQGRRALAEARKAKGKAIVDSAKSLEREAERLETYALNCIKRVGGIVETDTLTVKVQQNPAHVEILNEADIPNDYYTVKTTETINKKKIKDDLMAGYAVPGAALVKSERLVVK